MLDELHSLATAIRRDMNREVTRVYVGPCLWSMLYRAAMRGPEARTAFVPLDRTGELRWRELVIVEDRKAVGFDMRLEIR